MDTLDGRCHRSIRVGVRGGSAPAVLWSERQVLVDVRLSPAPSSTGAPEPVPTTMVEVSAVAFAGIRWPASTSPILRRNRMLLADLSDAELVLRTLDGEAAAFEALMRRHYDVVWQVAFVSARDRMAAEELSQDTFMRAYVALPQWRGDGSLRTWLCTICRRLCIDRARLKRLDTVTIEDAAPHALAGRSNTDDLPDRLDLRAAIDGLPDEERQAFLLIHHHGVSSLDAAEIIGVPASTLRSRVGRARERLGAALAEKATGLEPGDEPA